MLSFWLLVGFVLGGLFVVAARRHDVQKERVILAVGLLVAALIYVGFALLWGNLQWIAIEVGGLLLYACFVLLAQRHCVIWLVVGWAAHPLWDIGLHWLGQGHTVAPEWYVLVCLSFDLLVAAYMITRLNDWKRNLPRSLGRENVT
ncbi:MAG: hypothetical protein R2867_26825 [Caldilineaceae bacterium]